MFKIKGNCIPVVQRKNRKLISNIMFDTLLFSQFFPHSNGINIVWHVKYGIKQLIECWVNLMLKNIIWYSFQMKIVGSEFHKACEFHIKCSREIHVNSL